MNTGVGMLLAFSAVEINVYFRPHKFPKAVYSEILGLTVVLQRLAVTLVQYVQSGHRPMRAVHAALLLLQGVFTAMADACDAVGAVVGKEAPYSE